MPNDPKLMRIRDVPARVLELTGCVRCKLSVYYWIRHGRIAYDGRLLKLKTIKRLGTLLVNEDDLIEFLKEVR